MHPKGLKQRAISRNKPEKSYFDLKDDWNHIKADIDLKNNRGSSYYKHFIKGH